MPPRDARYGEHQQLLSCPMDPDQQLESDNESREPSWPRHSMGFWEAVQRRRDNTPNQQATTLSTRPTRSKWAALGFGQVVAFIAASVNVTSFTLENSLGVVAPSFQLFLMYIFLSLHLCFRSPLQQPSQQSVIDDDNDDGTEEPVETPSPQSPAVYEYQMPLIRGFGIRIPWYLYFFISCLDVGAGIIMLLSLQYTSLTSVTLLSSLTIPSTMLFCKILLNKSFYAHHFVGVCLCVAGGCLTIWADLEEKKNAPGGSTAVDDEHNRFLSLNDFQFNIGDFMAILAALLYGLGDATSEYAIKHIDRNEFLGMLGLFGMMLTVLQFPFQEMDTLSQLFGDPGAHVNAFLLMGGYVTLLLLYYVTEASFLVSSDATLLNLSLQAQNLWAILFSVLAYQTAPPALFYLAVLLVGVGVFTYELSGPSSVRVAQVASDSLNSNDVLALQDDVNARSGMGCKQGKVQYSSVQQIEVV